MHLHLQIVVNLGVVGSSGRRVVGSSGRQVVKSSGRRVVRASGRQVGQAVVSIALMKSIAKTDVCCTWPSPLSIEKQFFDEH